ncbi:MAG: UDP-glucose--hexose-1-phosphate uridylyltransferase [Saprospirales bacterium]|jgi:UDPglucose--hexose-1-phosphate uridylyltransferase|nr:UDP-glucose--hexose-1-phosphate uridylyltransferase [Saprospirales bacterium]MBK8922952.1 UDP-glucose--hexose-1-phosphate uridylyltransferase [Saprospirales bacterium]
MSVFNPSEHPHRRLNILTGEWMLVSPHRTRRPWQGKTEPASSGQLPAYDPTCYLCPGNTRANGAANPPYTTTYVFTNDFAALLPDGPQGRLENGLLLATAETGICRVVCFSPNHALSLSQMELADLELLVGVWQAEYQALGQLPEINHVQIFENKGAIMGCSNPHPHGQIWAQQSIPNEVQKKSAQQAAHLQKTGRSLLGDYLEQELALGERIVSENGHVVALVPFWAIWPFEAMIVPRRRQADITQLRPAEATAFAAMIKDLSGRYDRLFDTSFPYSAGIHQRPTDGREYPEWHWHMSFYPPLLRSATVKKFMVGYEMFAEPQRDITPEMAADMLRR